MVIHQVGINEVGQQVTAPQENHSSQKVRDEADNMFQQPLLFVNVPTGAQHTTVLGLL